MKRENYSTGSKWEEEVGYSRAVKVGPYIEVAGTTASDGEEVQHVGNAKGQTQVILDKIKQSLNHFDARPEHVIRMRIFVRYIEDWPEVTAAYSEHFKHIKPVLTLVQANFIHRDILVEIEASAILPEV